ncbi:MAG: endonuclease MutS2 [Eubacteriales bacterium]|nr:endonuclease MutS2 [Clostridiales bacterium]MDY5836329.1 endonuclease MutS2 [Eubacteriales bacterium]
MQEKSLRNLEFDKVLQVLAQEAKSRLGRALCLALRPSSDLDRVRLTAQETDDLVKEILKNGEFPLSALEDLSEILALLAVGSVAGPADLLRVARQIRLVLQLEGRLDSLATEESGLDSEAAGLGRVNTCQRLLQDLYPLDTLAERLDACILNDEELKDRASPELYRIRRSLQSLQEEVQKSLNSILRSQSDILQDQLITLRGDRYVLPVKAEYKGRLQGIVHDSSASGATVFIEPLQVVNLNNRIREAKDEEEREIHRILRELSSLVLDQADLLKANQDILAHLDFCQAKAKLAIKQKANPVALNRQGRIILRQARHPLIDPQKVVPIDFELGIHFTSLVITGPNTGGKTVSLKTCGLLTLMAMAGLQVPVKAGSELAVFDYVLADIGDEQSIEQSLSTFSAHIKQLIEICDLAGPSSLVLADELGAGTDPSEGAALAIAILDYLKGKGASVVASTHYQELKGYALNTPGVSNASCEFDSVSMKPTYRLLIGVPGVSNALAISTRLGLQEEIISHAKALISDEGAQFQSLIEAIERSEQESRKMEAQIADLHAQAEATKAENLAEQARLKQVKEELLNQARLEAHQILSQAEDMAEAELKKLRQAGSQVQSGELAKQEIRAQRRALETAMGEEKLKAGIDRPLEVEDLEFGQDYEDVITGFSGQLTEGLDSQNKVLLTKGNFSLRVPLANLRPCSKSKGAPESSKPSLSRRASSSSAGSSARLTTGPELYLLGYRVAEALDALDKYLDNAQLVGLHSVRIVHGKGSGALRQAIRDQLKHDKRVQTFGDAPFGAGDAGVTLVDLR